MLATSPEVLLPLGGFLIGALFGVVAEASNYCVMGAISDWRLMGDKTRLGAAALAGAVAIIFVQMLDAGGAVDLAASIYLTPKFNWLVVIAGGLIFGYGMVYAGGCPSRALIRVGGGDIRALVALMAMAVAALAALSGILGQARVALGNATALDLEAFGLHTQSMRDVLAQTALPGEMARMVAAIVFAGPLLWFAASTRLLSSPKTLLGGAGVGIAVGLGWALTGFCYDEMALHPAVPTSLSFVKPVSDAVDWLERSTALGLPGFGAASVFGVIAGGFLSAVVGQRIRLSGFADRADLVRHLGGAIGMGVGGIMAMGCTIGQGVTGLSTLSLSAPLAMTGIVAGAVLALERLKRTL